MHLGMISLILLSLMAILINLCFTYIGAYNLAYARTLEANAYTMKYDVVETQNQVFIEEENNLPNISHLVIARTSEPVRLSVSK